MWCSFTKDRSGSSLPRSTGSKARCHARTTNQLQRVTSSQGHVVSSWNPADVTPRTRAHRVRRWILNADHFRHRGQWDWKVWGGCRKCCRSYHAGLRCHCQGYAELFPWSFNSPRVYSFCRRLSIFHTGRNLYALIMKPEKIPVFGRN